MLRLVNKPNILQEKSEKEGWSRKRVIWQSMDANTLPDFPKLTLDELGQLTISIHNHQLKQARSYTKEHINEDGMYQLSVHLQCHNVVRIQIQSRHTSSQIYNLWIEYSDGINPITLWYCQCKSGAKTVGCCAHIASVLWYLRYYRHNDVPLRPVQN